MSREKRTGFGVRGTGFRVKPNSPNPEPCALHPFSLSSLLAITRYNRLRGTSQFGAVGCFAFFVITWFYEYA
jgi:hypothetical protein